METSVLQIQFSSSPLLFPFFTIFTKKLYDVSDFRIFFFVKFPHAETDYSFHRKGTTTQDGPTHTKFSLKLSWHLVHDRQPCATASGRCSMKIETANYTLADSLFPTQSQITCSSAYTSKWPSAHLVNNLQPCSVSIVPTRWAPLTFGHFLWKVMWQLG